MDLTPPETIVRGADTRAKAAYYRVMRESVEQFSGFRQLELKGLSIEGLVDVDLKPKNGMPDAYEKADHLHIDSR